MGKAVHFAPTYKVPRRRKQLSKKRRLQRERAEANREAQSRRRRSTPAVTT